MKYPTIEDAVGNTPLVALQRIGAQDNAARGNVVLGKLEGNNPAGSVKDRPALSMIRRAEERGDIRPGDTLIEATSGNTGIALAMAAAIKGYRMVLVMPEDLSIERAQTMKAFGAELVLTPKSGGMEHARDLAEAMQKRGEGKVLDQFANPDNPRIHYETTGPEIWEQTGGRSRKKARASRASASGRRSICPRFTTPAPWTSWCTWARTTPKTCAAAWRAKRASLLASRPPVRAGWRSRLPRARATPPSCLWCATGATVICPPACSRREARPWPHAAGAENMNKNGRLRAMDKRW